MMDKLIGDFTAQLKESLEIGKNLNLHTSDKKYKNILACGLGGSGIGANLVRDLVGNQLNIPMIVNKNYFIPGFVDEDTFVLLNSYSGNTEETIESLQKVEQYNCKITCVTSGGKLAAAATSKGYDLVSMPAEKPSPRACLGYSFILQLFTLHKHGFVNDDFIQQIEGSIQLLDEQSEAIKTKAKSIADILHNKIAVLYAPDQYESVAVRWRQQINENGKLLCWHHIIPEMNHNELVGWRTERDDLAVIFFDFENVYERIKTRKSINKDITQKYTPHIIELDAVGKNKMEQMLHMIHLGDWVSFYIAELRGVDAVEVDVIDYLKSELAKT